MAKVSKPVYAKPGALVDVVLLTLKGGELCVFLARRDNPKEPFHGALALPGGYIHVPEDKSTEATARRVLREKLSLTAPYLEQLYTFSGLRRDPRGWSLTVAHFALVPEAALAARPDVETQIHPVKRLPRLAFDHSEIVKVAVQRLRGKSEYSSLPFYLLPDDFTLSELQDVYEQVLGEPQNAAVFRRKMLDREMIVPVPGCTSQKGSARPAQVYRRGSADLVMMKTPI